VGVNSRWGGGDLFLEFVHVPNRCVMGALRIHYHLCVCVYLCSTQVCVCICAANASCVPAYVGVYVCLRSTS